MLYDKQAVKTSVYDKHPEKTVINGGILWLLSL